MVVVAKGIVFKKIMYSMRKARARAVTFLNVIGECVKELMHKQIMVYDYDGAKLTPEDSCKYMHY